MAQARVAASLRWPLVLARVIVPKRQKRAIKSALLHIRPFGYARLSDALTIQQHFRSMRNNYFLRNRKQPAAPRSTVSPISGFMLGYSNGTAKEIGKTQYW